MLANVKLKYPKIPKNPKNSHLITFSHLIRGYSLRASEFSKATSTSKTVSQKLTEATSSKNYSAA